jgi:hypothetical protein
MMPNLAVRKVPSPDPVWPSNTNRDRLGVGRAVLDWHARRA